MPGRSEADGVRAAADWVAGFLAPSYGPGGGLKLADDGELALSSSGAGALRVGGLRSPDLSPYLDLASSVQGHGGDHATGATLLAARLVLAGLRLEGDGVRRPATLDGLRLARRQAIAVLASLQRPDPDGLALGTVADPAWAKAAWSGLPKLARDGAVRLDDIEVATGPRVAAASWLDGLVVAPEPRPEAGPVRVALLDQPLRSKPHAEVGFVARSARSLTLFADAESERFRAAAERLRATGATLLIAPGLIPEPWLQCLHAVGVATLANTPLPTLRRIARSTGAEPAPNLDAVAASHLGRATLRRDGKRWLLVGGGPAATFEVPAATASHAAAAKEQAERLLRAAGLHVAEPKRVPGGGRWQREVAASLRRSADAAPGKSPLVLHAVADAVTSLADDLVRNLGLDPWRQPLHPQAEAAWDVAPAVRLAVAGAFDAAEQVLRVDARFARRSSSPVSLRGPGQPTKIRSGDVPPLM